MTCFGLSKDPVTVTFTNNTEDVNSLRLANTTWLFNRVTSRFFPEVAVKVEATDLDYEYVFDYWKDPFGNELEHWTDGDLFTAADPPQKMPMSALLAVQWGSPHPMFAGKAPPPPGLVSFFMALQLRIKRLFRRQPKGTHA